MIVVVDPEGSVRLEQANDLKRFHCEIRIPGATLEEARAALASVADLESREAAWVDVDALLGLARDSSSANWEASMRAMIEKARSYGWVRDEPLAVKGHVVWAA